MSTQSKVWSAEGQSAHVTRARGGSAGPRASSVEGEVDAQGAAAVRAQGRRVATGAAGEVEHGAGALLSEQPDDEVDGAIGLVLVAVRVEIEVVGAEGLLVPGHLLGHPTIAA